MNRITISLIFLIVISIVLPTSAIMYASGQSTDNSGDSSTDGSTTDNSGSSTTDNNNSTASGLTTDSSGSTTTTTDNSGSTTDGGTATDNSTTLPTTSTARNSTGNAQQQSNSTTLPTTSTTSDNTGNAQQQSNSTNSTKIPPYCRSCDDYIYNGTGDFASMILAGHNRERAALGVAPLVWSNEVAAHAQAWVNYNLAHGLFNHCYLVPGHEQIEPCKYEEGENLASRGHCEGYDPLPNGTVTCNVWKLPPAQMQEYWFAENPISHWLQVVSKNAKYIGCAYGTGPDPGNPYKFDRDLMSCRYSPQG
jgi:cysteine-rich secretory family protein